MSAAVLIESAVLVTEFPETIGAVVFVALVTGLSKTIGATFGSATLPKTAGALIAVTELPETIGAEVP